MSKKIWTTEETCRLIELYREANNLWNPKSPDYKNRIKKNDSLKHLGNVFNVTTPEIDRKLKNILSQYRRERRNYKKFKKSGAACNFHAKWFGYNLMGFLRDKNKARKGLQTVQETEVSDSSLSSDENEATQESLIETQDEGLTKNVQQEDVEVQEFEDQGSEQLATEENRNPDIALHTQQEENKVVAPIKNKNTMQGQNANKQKKLQNEPQMEMVNLMKTICKQREQRHELDEYDLYGELVARKLKKLRTNYARSTVQNRINTILYEAEIGNYDMPYDSSMQFSGYRNSSGSYSNAPSVTSYSNPPSVAAHSEFNNDSFGIN